MASPSSSLPDLWKCAAVRVVDAATIYGVEGELGRLEKPIPDESQHCGLGQAGVFSDNLVELTRVEGVE